MQQSGSFPAGPEVTLVAHTHDLRTDCRGGSQLAKARAERNLWICASDFHEQTTVVCRGRRVARAIRVR
jgi:hypothetical protein